MEPKLHKISRNSNGLIFSVRFDVSEMTILDRSSRFYYVLHMLANQSKSPQKFNLDLFHREALEWIEVGNSMRPEGRKDNANYGFNNIFDNVLKHYQVKRLVKKASEFIWKWLESVDYDPVLIAFKSLSLCRAYISEIERIRFEVSKLIRTPEDLDHFDGRYERILENAQEEYGILRENFESITIHLFRSVERYRLMDELAKADSEGKLSFF